eukprot:GHVT01015393.1.p2 GENE.GHVT01015393.1~~GHVT01015393.1.p2  ORF type:complete len:102 (+),score=13.62 GHVT01015393.1:393-698(+)
MWKVEMNGISTRGKQSRLFSQGCVGRGRRAQPGGRTHPGKGAEQRAEGQTRTTAERGTLAGIPKCRRQTQQQRKRPDHKTTPEKETNTHTDAKTKTEKHWT